MREGGRGENQRNVRHHQPVTRGYRERGPGEGGQWGEIPDINELVPDPVSWVATRHHQTHWPFMLTDDFITEVMSGLTAGKCGETQPTSFQRRKNDCLVFFILWIICYPCMLYPGSGYAELSECLMTKLFPEWRWGVCQLSNFGC